MRPTLLLASLLIGIAGCASSQKTQRPANHVAPVPIVHENPTLSQRSQVQKERADEENPVQMTRVQGAVAL